MKIKAKFLAILGAASASLGALGSIAASFSLCPCIIPSFISAIGIVSAIIGFFTENGIYLMISGISLFAIGTILYKKQKK